MNRRETLKFMLGGAALVGVSGLAGGIATAQQKPFTLPPLGYPYEALEPHIDTATMRIHHTTHHNAYVNNLNTIAEKWPELGTRPSRRPRAPGCATISAATGTTSTSGT